MGTLIAQSSNSFFGTIRPPAALVNYGESGGLIKFATNMLQFAVVVGGLIALFNVISAGYIYLTSAGDAKAHEKVVNKLSMTLWGIVLMILAPVIMGIVGFLLFKDPTYFLSPKISSPSSSQFAPGWQNIPEGLGLPNQ